MENVLNLVYDDWPEGQKLPNPNRPISPVFWIDNDFDINNFETAWEAMLAADSFSDIKTRHHKIEEVQKNKNKKFFYLIWSRCDLFFHFFKNNILPINAHVISLIKNNKNLELIFMNQFEPISKECLEKLDEILISNQIETSKVWIITNNEKIKKYKNELNTNINVHSSRIFFKYSVNEPSIAFKTNRNSSFFMCHNRMPKLHRIAILSLLKNKNIINDTDWSLVNGWQRNILKYNDEYFHIFKYDDIINLKNDIDYFENISRYKSKYEVHRTDLDDELNLLDFNEVRTYKNSFANIVTETDFIDEVIHITEKTFKPFWFLQFPLIFAPYEHVKYVKNIYNFDFFDDVIDHSYDNIKNNRDRLFAFVKEIERIHKNKEFFIQFYKDNEYRFIRNRDIIKNYKNNDDLNFFQKLINE